MISAKQKVSEGAIPGSWKPLLELAAREVFQIMLGTELEPAGEILDPPAYDFTAMVGLAGQLCGTLTLRCSVPSAGEIASKMLGTEPEQASEEMCDAIGEVCNMIAGNFKNKLFGLADGCLLSVPTVINGADYNFHSFSYRGTIELTLLFDGLPIRIALGVHS